MSMLKLTTITAAVLFLLGIAAGPHALGQYTPFDGGKSQWHDGFERFDYVMDEQTLGIMPFTAPEGETFAVRDPAKGQRRCVVVVPAKPAAGNPWSWRGCYWDHQPQTEVELLRRGFHIAYISANQNLRPGKEWDAWYAFLNEKHGLSREPAFIGMSRGGEFAYTWATAHPDSVSCIYADNPAGNRDIFARLGDLARNNVPLLHVCGSIDPLFGRVSTPLETIYQQYGGRISVIIKEGYGHHPHSLNDPKPIADFIEQSVKPAEFTPPAWLPARYTRTNFYSIENAYRDLPSQGTHIICRGPLFADCFDRYAFDLPGVEGTITVIAPKASAPGTPWVFRSAFVDRGNLVDLALLAKGFHIVTGPVPYDADGPSLAHWKQVYRYLTDQAFSKKPALEGAGGAGGDAIAWSVLNPDKVCCVYAENPILRSTMSKSLLESLTPLAKASVPILCICGSLDPALGDNSRALEHRYKDLGGSIILTIRDGDGHFLNGKENVKPAVDFMTRHAATP
jgi:pimeloyl-ACP methyl ester carboxylesterase